MQRMIRDLLDFTVIRHGGGLPVTPVPTDLSALCREVVAEIQQAYPRRTVRVTGEEALAGVWDPERLAQVLSNVLGNAIQHSPDAAPVALDVSLDGEAAAGVVRVWNAGTPIPPALLATVFDPFRQGSAQRSRDSVGLGLFIAQQIVAAHGGTIAIESAESSGTTVTIRIPVTDR
jgi:signal transduction histidine kinase